MLDLGDLWKEVVNNYFWGRQAEMFLSGKNVPECPEHFHNPLLNVQKKKVLHPKCTVVQ